MGEILDKAVRPATAVLCLGRRPITAEALGLVFGSCELRRLISQKTRNEAFVKNKAELVGLAANARIGDEMPSTSGKTFDRFKQTLPRKWAPCLFLCASVSSRHR
jgi:hypothetical protein